MKHYNYLRERIYLLENCDNIPMVDSPLNVKAISNHFWHLYSFGVDFMKLKNLVYLSYSYYLAIKNEILFNSYIEAWPYGVMIPSLYLEFVPEFGNDLITRYAIDYNGGRPFIPIIYDESKILFLNEIYKIFDKFTGIQLSNMTHDEDGPWYITWEKNKEKSIIGNDLIKDYFLKKLRKSNEGS